MQAVKVGNQSLNFGSMTGLKTLHIKQWNYFRKGFFGSLLSTTATTALPSSLSVLIFTRFLPVKKQKPFSLIDYIMEPIFIHSTEF